MEKIAQQLKKQLMAVVAMIALGAPLAQADQVECKSADGATVITINFAYQMINGHRQPGAALMKINHTASDKQKFESTFIPEDGSLNSADGMAVAYPAPHDQIQHPLAFPELKSIVVDITQLGTDGRGQAQVIFTDAADRQTEFQFACESEFRL